MTYAHDARNRQTQAFVGAIGTRFLINGLGQRIAQVNGSVPQFFIVYDEAGHLAGKYDGNGKFLQETVWLGDLPVAVLQPGGHFYIAPDHLGAPHQITDAAALRHCPASEESCPRSMPALRSARSYFELKAESKMREGSAGQLSQPLCCISASS